MGASAEAEWLRRRFVPFAAPIALAAAAYFATAGPLCRAYLGPDRDLGLAVESAVDLARRTPFDTVVLGNSRVWRGVDPTFLGPDSFNFAFDDDVFLYYGPKLRFLERNGHRLRRALLGVDVFQLGYWNYDRYPTYRRVLGDPELERWAFDPLYAPPLAWTTTDRLVSLRQTYRSALAASLTERLFRRPRAEVALSERYVLADNGFRLVTYGARRTLDPVIMPPARIDARAVALLEDAVKELRAKEVDVVLFVPPASAAFRALYAADDRARFAAVIGDLVKRHHVRFASWEDDPAFGEDDFPDEVHLSREGAERFSRILGAWLEGGRR